MALWTVRNLRQIASLELISGMEVRYQVAVDEERSPGSECCLYGMKYCSIPSYIGMTLPETNVAPAN